jgi:hypothetical protein
MMRDSSSERSVDCLAFAVSTAVRLKQMAILNRVFPDDPERHVSHETIYTAIDALPRGELRMQVVACLRHGCSTRMPRTRGEDWVMPGHREGDFHLGHGQQVLSGRACRVHQPSVAAGEHGGRHRRIRDGERPIKAEFDFRPAA